MNHRERAMAVLNYESYDHLPIVHFGFWDLTLELWAEQGHISPELARGWSDGNWADQEISKLLGFDFNWYHTFGASTELRPRIEPKVLEEFEDGTQHVLDGNGVIIVQKPGITSIPQEIDHLLKGREPWEEIYKPRLQWSPDRLNSHLRYALKFAREHGWLPPATNGNETVTAEERQQLKGLFDAQGLPIGIHCGSMIGKIRDYAGLVGLSYMTVDDPMLLEEMVETVAELCYQATKATLEAGFVLDFGHFWEDICYRAGPLVNPRFFKAKIGPGYRRITDLLHSHGIHIVSLDCDGKIDALIPTWLENGVNTMFPIEVGTWHASIKPWREKYGRELRGIGGMDKKVFAYDRAAIDAEVERLRELVDLGGYIPCPDHRIPADAKWENVQYYCERMRQTFA